MAKKGITMTVDNHEKLYKQAFNYGKLIADYKKSHASMRSPTPQEYANLPPAIKENYPNYNAYKTAIDNQNTQTRIAMKNKLLEAKGNYKVKTKGSDEETIVFGTEADDLIGDLGV